MNAMFLTAVDEYIQKNYKPENKED
jgi:hypothetical protein